ncbi:hypothetical protein SETIT_5G100500v2 [Setaria italica]|uniref:Uncharacterized protein n=2 Tax=Setaria italica TaxID=4555 RepID=A0A368R346_SETIT|nr:uncharacterized protein LOC101786484 [Setaria italica]RCV24621.1 hypothetical protein SETIT_5G100500v2 [Setaria italica]
MAPGTANNGRAGEAAGGTPKLHREAFGRGLLGLAAASTAITMAVREPPPGLNKTAYLLALSGAFFAGVTQVSASVWASDGPVGRRHGAGRKKIVYASLVVSAGLAVASLLQ